MFVAASTRTSTCDRLRAADARHDAVLQHAQHLRLRGEAHVADLVEEQRAAVGLLELPGAIGDRAGERALHVAEQLALDQLARNRRAVHLDERLCRRACDCEWIARATSSLPVPFSPVISTRAGVLPTCSILSITARIAYDLPTISYRDSIVSLEPRVLFVQIEVLRARCAA